MSSNLTKTWAFYYKKDGKRTEMGLGSVSNITLEQAREKATELRKQLANGIAPLSEKQRQDSERKAQLVKR